MKGKQQNLSDFHKSYYSKEENSSHETSAELTTFSSFHDNSHVQIQNSNIAQNELAIHELINHKATDLKNGWFFTGQIIKNPKVFVVNNEIRSILAVCELGNEEVTIDVIMTERGLKINKIVEVDEIYQFINGKINTNAANRIFVIIDEDSKIINLDNRNTKSKRNEKFRKNKINCSYPNSLFTIKDLLKEIPVELREGWYFIGYILDFLEPIKYGDEIRSTIEVYEISDQQIHIKVMLTEQCIRINPHILYPNQKYLFMNGVLNIGHSGKNFITMNENSKIMSANYLHGEKNVSANFVCQSALINNSETRSFDQNSQFITKSEKLPNHRRF